MRVPLQDFTTTPVISLSPNPNESMSLRERMSQIGKNTIILQRRREFFFVPLLWKIREIDFLSLISK